MKKRHLMLLVVIFLFVFSGCAKDDTTVLTGDELEYRQIVDREGINLEVPKDVKTIISLSPSITQILIELGLEDKIIGTDEYSIDLFENFGDRKVFDIMNPDAELLISLEPDIIFATSMSKVEGQDPLSLLKETGTVVTYIPVSNSIAEIEDDIIFISDVTNTFSNGTAIVNDMEKTIEHYRQIGDSITNKKSVYFEIAPSPKLYTFGNGVFLDEILDIIGAENIFEDEEGWITVDPESIVYRNPDVILTNVDYIENPIEEIINRPGFSNITAVANKDVYLIDNKISSYSNHNIVKALEEIAVLVYPTEYN